MPGNRSTSHHRKGTTLPFSVQRPPPSRRPHLVEPALRDAVYLRAGGSCELCGEALAGPWHWHHRKLLSQGGLDVVENGLALHSLCHHRVHGHVSWSTDAGFLVPTHASPARQRLHLHGERWVLLTTSGGYKHLGDR